jgi:cysteinyl-tRNA synthetase
LTKLREIAGSTTSVPAYVLLERFSAARDEDLNFSQAWGEVFNWVNETNRALAANQVTAEKAAAGLAAWEKVNSVLGVGATSQETEIPAEITGLLEQRQAARKAKDFKRSDQIRDELKAKGWVIEDTPKGPRLKRA